MDSDVQDVAIDHPRGIYTSRVDEKGRLKLPSDFQQYLTARGDTRVFITSFDERIARIYGSHEWRQVELLLREGGDDPEGAEDLWFTAQDLGANAEMDNQGRLLMPPALRRAMNVENQPVYLEHHKGHIKVYGSEVYQERKQRAAQNRGSALKSFERRGLI